MEPDFREPQEAVEERPEFDSKESTEGLKTTTDDAGEETFEATPDPLGDRDQLGEG